MKKIYLIVDNESFFAEHIEFGQLNKDIIIEYFQQKNIKIDVISFSDLVDKLDIKCSIIFTVSSQKPYHKLLIEDIYEVLDTYNILIPSKNIVKSHENKGYQELYKKIIGLSSLKAMYINKNTINYNKVNDMGYPLVLKKLSGSGSRGIQLINSAFNLKKEINKIKISFDIRYAIYVKEKIKNIFLRKRNTKKIEYFKDYENYVIQEFVPNLTFDYKVLIFFDKYYVLKRNINANDFRASGSGNFEFVEIEDSLLEYCENVFQKFNEPFISLDICFDGSKYYLIEYQGIHFGPYTQISAKGYYFKKGRKWHFKKEKNSFEVDLAYSFYRYILSNQLLKAD